MCNYKQQDEHLQQGIYNPHSQCCILAAVYLVTSWFPARTMGHVIIALFRF